MKNWSTLVGTIALATCGLGHAADGPAMLERVEVTGSRLSQIAGESASPVQIISREQIERSGAQTVEEVLAQSSSFFGRPTDAGLLGNPVIPGQSMVGMRTLPGTNVLVLLNGRRLISYAFGHFGVDLHAIPVAALDRVEILKDGASAVYGSDAHAGVMNFITRSDFRGAETVLYGGTTHAGGASSARVTLTLGAGDLETDGYNGFIVLDHRDAERLTSSDRPFASTGVRPQDGLDAVSVSAFPANIPRPRGVFANPAAPACTELTVPRNGGCYFDFAKMGDLIAPTEDSSLLARGALRLAADRQLYAELLLARHQTDDAIVPIAVNSTTTVDGSPLVLPESSPFYPEGLGLIGDLVNLRYRTVPLGSRVRRTVGEHGRALLGLRGEAGAWAYDAALGYVTSRGTQQYRSGYVDSTRIVDAFATGLVNPFGDSGPVGNALLADTELRGEVRRAKGQAYSIDVRANREIARLAGGPVQIVVGSEARYESLLDAPSALAGQAVGAGSAFPVPPPSEGSRQSQAVFGEVGLPLGRTVEAQLALRADHYGGGVGSSVNPKIALKWQALPALLLRASGGTGFLAPSLPELYTARSASVREVGPDPVRCPVTGLPEDCNVEATVVTGGNPALKPSKSKQASLGLVVSSGTVQLSLDAWRIRVDDGIWQTSVDLVLSGDPQYEGRNIVRASPDPATGLPGSITQVLAVHENIGRSQVSGVDLHLQWRMAPRPWGRLAFDLDGTYVSNAEYADGFDCVGCSDGSASVVRWQHYMTLGWDYEQWAATLGQTYRRGYIDAFPDGQGEPRRVSDYIVWDAQIAWRTSSARWRAIRLALGAKNLFDRDPPFANQRSYPQIGYDPFYADPRGRFVYATLSLSYGP